MVVAPSLKKITAKYSSLDSISTTLKAAFLAAAILPPPIEPDLSPTIATKRGTLTALSAPKPCGVTTKDASSRVAPKARNWLTSSSICSSGIIVSDMAWLLGQQHDGHGEVVLATAAVGECDHRVGECERVVRTRLHKLGDLSGRLILLRVGIVPEAIRAADQAYCFVEFDGSEGRIHHLAGLERSKRLGDRVDIRAGQSLIE